MTILTANQTPDSAITWTKSAPTRRQGLTRLTGHDAFEHGFKFGVRCKGKYGPEEIAAVVKRTTPKDDFDRGFLLGVQS